MVQWRLVWERHTGGRRELVVDSVAALRAARRAALDHPDTIAVRFFRMYDNRQTVHCAAGHAVPPAQVSVRDVCRCGLAHVRIGSCGHLGCTAPRDCWDPPFGEGCGPLPVAPEDPRFP